MENKIYRWVKAIEAKEVTPDSTIRWKDDKNDRWISCRAEAFTKEYYITMKDAEILEPIPSQNQEEGWNAIVSRIAAADLMSKTIPGDNESVERWKKKAIDVLSKQFILIKKEQ